MKKIICLIAVVLMIAAVAYAAQKIVITEKNLPGLKGTWEGIISFGYGFDEIGGTSFMTLEILADKPSIKGIVTVANVPNHVAMQFGEGGGQKVVEIDDGIITSQGTIMWAPPDKTFFEFTLVSEKKGRAWYFWRGMRGEAILSKK
jgi:hypothetical protein